MNNVRILQSAILVSLTTLWLCGNIANATQFTWDPGPSDDWHNPANWDVTNPCAAGGVVPDDCTGTLVVIDNGATAQITAEPAEAGSLILGDQSGSGNFGGSGHLVSAQKLTIEGVLEVANNGVTGHPSNFSVNSTLTMNNSADLHTTNLKVGGIRRLNPSNIAVGGEATGSVSLNGGDLLITQPTPGSAVPFSTVEIGKAGGFASASAGGVAFTGTANGSVSLNGGSFTIENGTLLLGDAAFGNARADWQSTGIVDIANGNLDVQGSVVAGRIGRFEAQSKGSATGNITVTNGDINVSQQLNVGITGLFDDSATGLANGSVVIDNGALTAGALIVGRSVDDGGTASGSVIIDDGSLLVGSLSLADSQLGGQATGELSLLGGEGQVLSDAFIGDKGTLTLGISSATDYGRLHMDGSASVAGSIVAAFVDDFLPADGDVFELLTAPKTFDVDTYSVTITGVNEPGYSFDIERTDTFLRLTAIVDTQTSNPGGGNPNPVPEPTSLVLLGLGLAGVRLLRRG